MANSACTFWRSPEQQTTPWDSGWFCTASKYVWHSLSVFILIEHELLMAEFTCMLPRRAFPCTHVCFLRFWNMPGSCSLTITGALPSACSALSSFQGFAHSVPCTWNTLSLFFVWKTHTHYGKLNRDAILKYFPVFLSPLELVTLSSGLLQTLDSSSRTLMIISHSSLVFLA